MVMKVAADALGLLVGGVGRSNRMAFLTPAASAPRGINKQQAARPIGNRFSLINMMACKMQAIDKASLLLVGPMPESKITWMSNDLTEVRQSWNIFKDGHCKCLVTP